ncbi:HAD-like domain-containing protein [Podospora aff. communis PSN243]|uniref:HAD-like domain-containing protein n=1 Tax=Podospora aff. communis PSN243 TaxID=3040156 RepID=A0AAV9G9S1_9PEZI|nr:HAD-like domain-containing protein [Podospora aff. communis PSN243]
MTSPLPIKALTFDVFGTVVDWRTSITTALTTALTSKLSSPQSLPSIPLLAQQWRTSYSNFTTTYNPSLHPWKDIDTHHHDSLLKLLSAHNLTHLFSASEVETLSKQWHFLTPWPDSAAGIKRLNSRYVTATLSNGNLSLLKDLNEYGDLGFRELISAEEFRAYKPNPSVYLGACERLGLDPGEVAMVAAHLGDLEAARKLGMRTVYVERREEEAWKVEEARYQEARGWVDVWVGVEEGGMEGVARRLGC